jgi:hypothetical protein
MFSDEGGVGTTSSAGERCRAVDFGGAERRFVPFEADLCALLTAAFRVGRLAERATGRFVAAFLRPRPVRFALALAFRLAIVQSFRNLDSFRVSVVLSNAYRNSRNHAGAGTAKPTDR